MNTVPTEVLEEIIAYTPTEELFSLCYTNRTLFKLVRHEAYKRWKQCAVKYGELFWEEQDLNKFWNELEKNDEPDESPAWKILDDKMRDNCNNLTTVEQEQLIIMRKMKNHSMIIDEQEKEIIDYCTNKAKYSLVSWRSDDTWELSWSWRYDEWSEYDTSEDSASEESEYVTSEDSTSEDEW